MKHFDKPTRSRLGSSGVKFLGLKSSAKTGTFDRSLTCFNTSYLKTACQEFEERMKGLRNPRGEKTALIIQSIHRSSEIFRIADIQRKCPGISVDMIRKVLKDLRAEGRVKCLGMGKAAQWKRVKKWRN